MKSHISKVRPSTKPRPKTLARLASPISDWTTMIVTGLFGTWLPFFLMLTRCSPTSRGMNEMPTKQRNVRNLFSFYSCYTWFKCLNFTKKWNTGRAVSLLMMKCCSQVDHKAIPICWQNPLQLQPGMSHASENKRPLFILFCLWTTVANTINYLVQQHSSGKEHRSQSSYKAKQTGVKTITVISQILPMWLLGSLFRRQGSSRPDGALMLAVRRLRSVSLISNMKSAAEPSLTWDRLLLSSEYIKRNESQNITS